MVSSFQFGYNNNPIGQTKYSTPGAMEQTGLEDLQVPWATSVLPAIWKNTETTGDIFKGSENISNLNTEAYEKGEERVSAAELNAMYPHMHFDTSQYASTAKYMAERQTRIQDLEWLKEHSTVKTPGAMFLPELGSYIAKSFTDPTELALMIGTAALTKGAGLLAPQLTKFTGTGLAYKMAGMAMHEDLLVAQMLSAYLPLSARTTGRFVQGFAENAISNATIEPWIASSSKRLGDDYTAMSSAMNVLVGGLTGGVFHTTMGAVADPFTRMTTENKLKAAAGYLALRANGEDGLMAAAQNVLPVSSLSAQDIYAAKNVTITKSADGQYVAKFTDEQGLLRNAEGIIGRTPGDAIRNLQYIYAKKMNDSILFHQLNKTYGTVTPARTAGRNVNPFTGDSKLASVKNTTTVRRGTNKYKLDFESPADRVFYALNKILYKDKNKGKSFSEIKDQREALMEAVEWITQNLGDTTEADIRSHAMRVAKHITKQADKAFMGNDPAKGIKIPAIIKITDFDVQPEFLSVDAWKKRLNKQKEILLGADKEAAINLLGEIYNADREVYKARLESLKIARGEIQKLISATDEQLKAFSKRDLARKNSVDSIKAATKHITDEQLTQYLYMLDVVTGDFARFLEENNIVYTASKEQQLKTEKRLRQTVMTKSNTLDIREQWALGLSQYEDIRTIFFTEEDIYSQVHTTMSENITDADLDVIFQAKAGKYHIQDALYTENTTEHANNLTLEEQQQIERDTIALDNLIQKSHTTTDLVVYRGVPDQGSMKLIYGNVQPGQIIQTKGFLSASVIEDTAYNFAIDSDTPVVLKIVLPKGMKAVDLEVEIARNLAASKYKDLRTKSPEELYTISEGEIVLDGIDQNKAERAAFTLYGALEGEVMLPRDLALKVLDVQDDINLAGGKLITVTPDATLNNIYGSNILRENVDLFFNKVQEMNTNYKIQLDQLQIGTPEHKAIATKAFFNGYILSDEIITAYPELRIARDLAQEIPGTWLMQATNKESLANRIVGEFMQDVPLENFQNQYGHNYVYALGNGRYTKSPALAIAETGKAVLYEIGAGPRYRLDLEGPLADIKPVINELLKWEPALQNYLSKGPKAQMQILQRLAVDAINFVNTSGVSFLQYLDAMNLTDRKKIKKQTMWSRLSVNENEIIYPLQNIPGEIKQIGEVKLFEGMDPAMMDVLDAEVIYKSIISGEINKVENLQTEVVKLQKEQNNLKKQKPTQEITQNQLDTQVKTQAKELKKAKNEVEKAKKVRETKINNINKKAEPYNAVIKGAVDVGTEGKYIVTLFQNADISTLVHETAHIFRRTVLDADMLEQAERALGVKDGKWTVKNEEDFAVAFEKYLAEGKAPVKGLEAMFEAFKSWLTQIYMKLSQSPMEQDFSPEIRKVFDQLFAEERVRMAEQAGLGHESVTKQMYQNALTQHKDSLAQINKTIKDTETLIKNDRVLDQATFAQFRQEKLARIQSKLNMLDTPDTLTSDEIRDKMKEVSNEVRRAENEYAEVAEGQFQKNQEFKSDDIAFYENELVLAETGLTTYAKTLGLTDEQINLLLNEVTDDLNIAKLDEETMANDILEGALREFSDCARGEL